MNSVFYITSGDIYYHRFLIPKHNGKSRAILAPNPKLKKVQKEILWTLINKPKDPGLYYIWYKGRLIPGVDKNKAFDEFKYQVTSPILPKPHPSSTGFVKNKNAVYNAYTHFGAKSLLEIDIKDFFPSIKAKKWLINELSASDFIVNLLTYRGGLPTGAPTSPYLANCYMYRFDKFLTNYAQQNQCVYTRYADDITISSKDPHFNFRQIQYKIIKLLKVFGLKPNKNKTRILRNNKRLEITGIVINTKINIPREYWKTLRATIHNIKKSKNTLLKNSIQYNQLLGKINWVMQLNHKRGLQLLNALNEITHK